jgi:N-acetylmuramic acid 6-phosphate etherase|tara:strand:- start:297 stop:1109 length:813 start_codon:yes stop_codon:yes gene_type:complete
LNKFIKITEQNSKYNSIENKSVDLILKEINGEDQSVAHNINKELDSIEKVIHEVIKSLKNNGRLFYIGSGTSGRMGILDASECPPTFGVENVVIGIIAGGDKAIRNSQEFAEDSKNQGWLDLKEKKINKKDLVIGIAASGTTPYVINAIKKCNENNIPTACITCNKNSPLANESKFPIEIIVGPEYITGSSRMKAGTAQKMVLNMISTSVMVKLGKVKGNLMIDMQLSNNKLIERAINMIISSLNISYSDAEKLIKKHGSVRKVIENYNE